MLFYFVYSWIQKVQRRYKNFRQLNSICAGHPEYKKGTVLKQQLVHWDKISYCGYGNSRRNIQKKFSSSVINNKTYVIASDGDLMEGISHEAMSLAGHLKLKNLIVFLTIIKFQLTVQHRLVSMITKKI